MKDKPELQALVEAITSYRQMLKLFGIKDEQVKYFKKSWCKQIWLLLISLIRLCLSLIFVIPGNIMIFPLGTMVTFYAEKERIKALNASTVKIKANDVLASIKCLAYIITFPFYLLITTLVFRHFFLRRYWEYTRSDSWLMALGFFVIFPIF